MTVKNLLETLSAEELSALTLKEAEAIVEARNEASLLYWGISVEELIAFYALGVRKFSYANLNGANLRRRPETRQPVLRQPTRRQPERRQPERNKRHLGDYQYR